MNNINNIGLFNIGVQPILDINFNFNNDNHKRKYLNKISFKKIKHFFNKTNKRLKIQFYQLDDFFKYILSYFYFNRRLIRFDDPIVKKYINDILCSVLYNLSNIKNKFNDIDKESITIIELYTYRDIENSQYDGFFYINFSEAMIKIIKEYIKEKELTEEFLYKKIYS